MKKSFILFIMLGLIFITLAACSINSSVSDEVKVEKVFLKSGTDDSNYVELSKINDSVWVHTTYSDYNGYRTPANGLLVVTSKGLVLVDTPWNNGQTRELMELTENTFKQNISVAIITHAHDDTIGGISTLLENGVDVRSTGLTVKEAEKIGFEKPQPKLDTEPKFQVGSTKIETFYPGEGHSTDNIIVCFPQYKVLFGGCLIKSLESESLGNTKEAHVNEWPSSVKKVLDEYPDVEIVIPGHGNWGGLDLISHTLDLF